MLMKNKNELRQILVQINQQGVSTGWDVVSSFHKEIFKSMADKDGNIQIGVYSIWKYPLNGNKIIGANDINHLLDEVNTHLQEYNSKGVIWSYSRLSTYKQTYNRAIELDVTVNADVDEDEAIMNILGYVPKVNEVAHIAERHTSQ